MLTIKKSTLEKVSLGYLLLPFLIFALRWMKPVLGVLVVGAVLFVFVRRRVTDCDTVEPVSTSWKILVPVLALFLAWVALSGVGGFAFQNWDFHWRNALLHDLIEQPWPVAYNLPEISTDHPTTLVYYFAFFLPSAFVGKLIGWQMAQITLFLWTLTGLLLVWFNISVWLKKSSVSAVLLLIFFSGMDIVGYLIFHRAGFQPIIHIENWSFHQISSNTTLLFWVFNQAVPCWLATILILNSKAFDFSVFVWSLSFFFSPIAAVGQLPLLILKLLGVREEPHDGSIKKYVSTFIQTVGKSLYSLPFYLAGVILVISASFFAANILKVDINLPPVGAEDVIVVLLAFLLDGGLLILLLLRKEKHNSYLWMTLVLFTLSLLLIIGPFNFGMRFVISTTFLLMLYCTRAVLFGKTGLKIVLVIILLLGSVTAIFEINRSVYRTFLYYTNRTIDETAYDVINDSDLIEFPSPEYAHPYSLVADDLTTLSNTGVTNNWNYYGDLTDHWFTRIIFKQP